MNLTQTQALARTDYYRSVAYLYLQGRDSARYDIHEDGLARTMVFVLTLGEIRNHFLLTSESF